MNWGFNMNKPTKAQKREAKRRRAENHAKRVAENHAKRMERIEIEQLRGYIIDAQLEGHDAAMRNMLNASLTDKVFNFPPIVMDAITEIINIVNDAMGNYDCILIKNRGYQPLHIEKLSSSYISIAHYRTINGDLVPDPEMEFRLKDGVMYPLCFRNEHGITEINQRSVYLLHHSARSWNERIRQQGFVEAAKSKDNVEVGML